MNEIDVAVKLFLNTKKEEDITIVFLKFLRDFFDRKMNIDRILQEYIKFVENEKYVAIVKSNINLTNEIKTIIEDKVNKAFDKEIYYFYEIDKNILGITITVNDKLLDLTLDKFIK